MGDILEQIVEATREEVARRKRSGALDKLRDGPPPEPREFAGALARPGMSVIAEFKRRSPSRGVLSENADAAEVARTYERSGAAALSVLTDSGFFGGSDEDLQRARAATELPTLRKDFTIDEYQLYEAQWLGADAVLLIVRILGDVQLSEYLALAGTLGMAALVEAHDEGEIERAVACGAQIIGVNSRDLSTFQVSLERTLDMRARVPADRVAVAESGVRSRADARRVAEAGFDALLVGEALMQSADPGAKLRELLGERPARAGT
jgi:indole-3-glycerol phosphate synthase